MTTVVFFKSGNIFYGFEERGHTGYAEAGNDILCSAISAMTMLLINAIEVGYASDVEYTIDEETTNIRVIARAALPGYEKIICFETPSIFLSLVERPLSFSLSIRLLTTVST